MHTSRIFFYSCLAFSAGACASSFFRIPEIMTLGALGIAVAVFVVSVFTKKHIRYLAVGLGIAAFALGIIRHDDVLQRWQYEREEFLTAAKEATPSTLATITSRDRLGQVAQYELGDVSLARNPKTRWLLRYTGREIFRAGERIEIQNPRFDTSKEAENFLKRDGAGGTLTFPKEVMRFGNACPASPIGIPCTRYRLTGLLSGAKESFERHLELVLPEPHAALAAGLLLGTRSALPQDIKDDFKRTGLSHIVAVSGYNITILILAISTLLGFFMVPRVPAFWLVTLFIALFTFITGAGSSIVRASLMGFLVVLAQKESRMYSARVALSFAGAAMLFHNPMLVRYDLGFALSFLATAGLLVLYPLLEERAVFLKGSPGIGGIVLQSVSAQLFVLPIIIIAFGSVSLIFLVSNIAILPFIPATMFFSFTASIAGFMGQSLGRVAAFPAYVLLHYEIEVIALLSKIPYATLAITSLTLRWMLSLAAIGATTILTWRLKSLRT